MLDYRLIIHRWKTGSRFDAIDWARRCTWYIPRCRYLKSRKVYSWVYDIQRSNVFIELVNFLGIREDRTNIECQRHSIRHTLPAKGEFSIIETVLTCSADQLSHCSKLCDLVVIARKRSCPWDTFSSLYLLEGRLTWKGSAHDENKIWKDCTVQFWTQSILPSKESLPCSGKTVLSSQTSPWKHCMDLKFY